MRVHMKSLGDVLALCSQEIKGRKHDCLGAGTQLRDAWLGRNCRECFPLYCRAWQPGEIIEDKANCTTMENAELPE